MILSKPMKGVACIISFGNIDANVNIETELLKAGFSTKTVNIKKCVHLADISEFLIPDATERSSLEKSYLRDIKKDQAAIVALQKTVIQKIVEQNIKSDFIFIEDDYCPENFYLRKILFQKYKKFFSFGNIGCNNETLISLYSLDIGFDAVNFEKFEFLSDNNEFEKFGNFNGSLAIEAPPDTIPYKYLFYFKSPNSLVQNIIKSLKIFYGEKRHPAVYVLNPVRPYNSYSSSGRSFQIEKLLGKRGQPFNNSSELPKGTTVLTWSTKRFFTLLNQGHRPIPLTNCLASVIFNLRKKSFNELITSNPSENDILRLTLFLRDLNVKSKLAEIIRNSSYYS